MIGTEPARGTGRRRGTATTPARPGWAYAIVGVAPGLVVFLYLLTLPAIGVSAAAMFWMILPLLAGALLGMWRGILVGVLTILAACVLFAFTVDDWLSQATRPGFVIGHLANLAVAGVLGRLRDIDGRLRREIRRREQVESELRAAKLSADAASEAKSTFLANMSHEIRTPMSGVLGLAELLQEKGLNAEQRGMVDNITVSARALLAVINDVLDFSKIEAGKLELETVDVDLGQIVSDVVVLITPSANAKDLEVDARIDEAVPAVVRGDPARLRQALLNLAGNAIKFTARGRVSIQVELAESTTERQLLRFAVEDSGIGVDPERVEALFEPFAQLEAATARKFGGTGLGLSISRRLARLMGGEIGARSNPGQGSTFWFTAALETAEEGSEPDARGERAKELAAAAAERTDGARRRILIVEDNAVNRDVFRQMAEALSYQVTVAEHGGQALEKLAAARFDVVLMDVRMPVLDGIEATRKIRDPESNVLDHDVPIVALTAHAMGGDRERFLEAGMNDYLTKPLRLAQLEDVIARNL